MNAAQVTPQCTALTRPHQMRHLQARNKQSLTASCMFEAWTHVVRVDSHTSAGILSAGLGDVMPDGERRAEGSLAAV